MKKLNITAEEIQLEPITEPLPALPDSEERWPPPSRKQWCECKDGMRIRLSFPKRHSLVCFCPKCGCVTQDERVDHLVRMNGEYEGDSRETVVGNPRKNC